jgi:hypothetical protein
MDERYARKHTKISTPHTILVIASLAYESTQVEDLSLSLVAHGMWSLVEKPQLNKLFQTTCLWNGRNMFAKDQINKAIVSEMCV